MKLRSTIDWNEIVPLLKKELRDTLMLEAVLMLSETPRARQFNGRRTHGRSTLAHPQAPRVNGDRSWYETGDGETLSAPGRRYRVNKDAPRPPYRGKLGAIWKALVASKNDVIAYDGIAAICKGQKAAVSATIAQLWERHFIEVEAKKIAQAY